jgi:hypothetical protein
MSDPLKDLARRVEGDPFFLAAALAHYARSEGLDDDGLTAALGCTGQTLTALRLCRRPGAGPHPFGQDIDRISSHFGVDATVLTEAVRRWEVLRRLRKDNDNGRGTLLAAREEPPPDPEDGPAPGGTP